MQRQHATIFILFLACIFFVFGCASKNKHFLGLETGKSSLKDVRASLGQPDKISTLEDKQIWTYTFLKEKSPPKERKIMELSITFKNGLLEDYTMSLQEKSLPPQKRIRPPRHKMPKRFQR